VQSKNDNKRERKNGWRGGRENLKKCDKIKKETHRGTKGEREREREIAQK
jgi:hypothetical protein